MDELRKRHNDYKRSLIHEITRKGDEILDVGCGFGGDLKKWSSAKAKITMCEPNSQALEEAKRRANDMKMRVNFYFGDIFGCPLKKYDIICYNFSLQYIFANRGLFFKTITEISKRIKKNGKFIGIIPDSEYICMKTPYEDELGNYFQLTNGFNGMFGDYVNVYLADTPYYTNGYISEPIAYKDLLIRYLGELGFELDVWEHLDGSGISRFYSKFIFTYSK